jgi:hypothetical protein
MESTTAQEGGLAQDRFVGSSTAYSDTPLIFDSIATMKPDPIENPGLAINAVLKVMELLENTLSTLTPSPYCCPHSV